MAADGALPARALDAICGYCGRADLHLWSGCGVLVLGGRSVAWRPCGTGVAGPVRKPWSLPGEHSIIPRRGGQRRRSRPLRRPCWYRSGPGHNAGDRAVGRCRLGRGLRRLDSLTLVEFVTDVGAASCAAVFVTAVCLCGHDHGLGEALGVFFGGPSMAHSSSGVSFAHAPRCVAAGEHVLLPEVAIPIRGFEPGHAWAPRSGPHVDAPRVRGCEPARIPEGPPSRGRQDHRLDGRVEVLVELRC